MTMRDNIDLGTFTARAADINRRSLAAKHKRDQQFTALIGIHIAIIAATVFVALSRADDHYKRQALIEQENIAWGR